MAGNGDIMDLEGNDEVDIEREMRPMIRDVNIRQRHAAINMLDRMHADELRALLNSIDNPLPLAIFMFLEDDLDIEILLLILVLYQTVNDDLINLVTWVPPVQPPISQASSL